MILPEALAAVKAEQGRRGKRRSVHTTAEQSNAALRRQQGGSARFTPPVKRTQRRGGR